MSEMRELRLIHLACMKPCGECECDIPTNRKKTPPKLVNASAKSVTSPGDDSET